MEEIKVGVEEKKKTQGMRRDLGHKGCGWVTLPALRKILTSLSVKGDKSFDMNIISWMG